MIRTVATTIVACALMAAGSADAQSLVISRAGSRSIRSAPAQNFTGGVQVEMLFEALAPSDATAGTVTFEPGARTAWHTHPRGQVLVITAGTGRVQRWGDPIEEVRAGDVVQIPAGQKHWHGASPNASMTHIAITEELEGTRVQWMEKVTDEQYGGGPRPEGRAQAPALAQPQSGQTPQPTSPPQATARPSGPLQQKVAPGMAALTDDVLYGDVWNRRELSPRDRSLVTITALIAMGKTAPLSGHLGRALDNGVQPGEASGLLAHLAIYCGWPSAVAALDAYDQVYTARKIDTAALGAMGPRLPASASHAARAGATNETLAGVAPKFAQLTEDVVFDDLWRRSDLSLRDRSLVTIVATAAMGDADQLEFYVRRGLENGLTRDQIAEAFTHLGFYTGWGRATKAMTALAALPKR
jgi:4-carboxymuconolactone decarboxylase